MRSGDTSFHWALGRQGLPGRRGVWPRRLPVPTKGRTGRAATSWLAVLTWIVWGTAATTTTAAQIVVTDLPATSAIPASMSFQGTGSAQMRLDIEGYNGRGVPLGAFVHIAEADFTGPNPTLTYHSLRLQISESGTEGTLTENGLSWFCSSVCPRNAVVSWSGISGMADGSQDPVESLSIPDRLSIAATSFLTPEIVEQVRQEAGLSSLEVDSALMLGSPSFVFVVPEPGTGLLTGLGLVLMGAMRPSRENRPRDFSRFIWDA